MSCAVSSSPAAVLTMTSAGLEQASATSASAHSSVLRNTEERRFEAMRAPQPTQRERELNRQEALLAALVGLLALLSLAFSAGLVEAALLVSAFVSDLVLVDSPVEEVS